MDGVLLLLSRGGDGSRRASQTISPPYRNKAAEQLANHILQTQPDFKGLFFVEGISEAGNVDAGACLHALG